MLWPTRRASSLPLAIAILCAWGAPPAAAAPPPQLSVTTLEGGLDEFDLVEALVGDVVAVSNVSFRGHLRAGGLFTGGLSVVGFEEGLVLSTGRATAVVGPDNTSDSTSWVNNTQGDSDLDELIPGFRTHDAALLEFDFGCSESDTVSFQFVFSSEEYNEFVSSQANDIFALFINGEHVAAIPGTTRPVSVNSINCGFPYNPPDGGSSCDRFINNRCLDLPGGPLFPCTGAVATEMDGLSVVLSATATLRPGTNHLKIAIADAADSLFDSNVFVRAGSLMCAEPVPAFEPPTPCGQILMASVGVPIEFDVVAIATNGEGDQEVSLTVSGDPRGAVFDPPLPAGPAQPVMTHVTWTPTTADVGSHIFLFTATDQFGVFEVCRVQVDVAECYLVVGGAPGDQPLPLGGLEDRLLVTPTQVFPVTLVQIPDLSVPDLPGLAQARFYFQIYMVNPLFDPLDPVKTSNALEVRVGGPSIPYGPQNGMALWLAGSSDPGASLDLRFSIDGM